MTRHATVSDRNRRGRNLDSSESTEKTDAARSFHTDLQQRHGNRAIQAAVRADTGGGVTVAPRDVPAERQAKDVAETVIRSPRDVETERSSRLIRKEDTESLGTPDEPGLDQLSTGRSLPSSLRTWFERRLSASFNDVRIHTGTAANYIAQSIQAAAFTRNEDIAFRKGRFDPDSSTGIALLAHELTHVLQQRDTSQGAGVVYRQPESERSEYRQRIHDRRHEPFGEPTDLILMESLQPTHLDEDGAFSLELLWHLSTKRSVPREQGTIGPLVLDILERSPSFRSDVQELNAYYAREDTPEIAFRTDRSGKHRFKPGDDRDVILVGWPRTVFATLEEVAAERAAGIFHETAHAHRHRIEGVDKTDLSSFIEDERLTREREQEMLIEAGGSLANVSSEESQELAEEVDELVTTEPRSHAEIRLDTVSGTELTYVEYYLLTGAERSVESSFEQGRSTLEQIDEFFVTNSPDELADSHEGRNQLLVALARNAPEDVDAGWVATEEDTEQNESQQASAVVTERAQEVAETISRADTALSAEAIVRIVDVLSEDLESVRGEAPSPLSDEERAVYDYVRLFRIYELREIIEAERRRARHHHGGDAFRAQAENLAATYLGQDDVY